MKTLNVFFIMLVLVSQTAYSDENTIDSLGFVPQSYQDAQTVEWKTLFSDELSSLIGNTEFSSKAVRTGLLFCRNAEFTDDPMIAARMVYDLLVQTDYLFRSGHSVGEVKLEMRNTWANGLGNGKGLGETYEKLALKTIKEDLTVLKDKDSTFPKEKKDKKDKLDKKIK